MKPIGSSPAGAMRVRARNAPAIAMITSETRPSQPISAIVPAAMVLSNA